MGFILQPPYQHVGLPDLCTNVANSESAEVVVFVVVFKVTDSYGSNNICLKLYLYNLRTFSNVNVFCKKFM